MQQSQPHTIVVIGAGAAGLMAAIVAGRTARDAGRACRIIALDGARTLGAKILVAGGGRCNVTHHAVDETCFAGSTRPAIRNVLRRWSVQDTIAFFAELGVTLKREETGKLFPTTDSARTVLDALLGAARDAGVELVHPWRVERVERVEQPQRAPHSPLPPPPALSPVEGRERVAPRQSSRPGEGGVATCPSPVEPSLEALHRYLRVMSTTGGSILADRVILATGGLSLPKTGSDGHGHAIARSLGHTITPRVFPALVPLLLPDGHPLRSLSGIASDATVEVHDGRGKRIVAFTDAVLCTHFGLSGPAILDVSRWWTEAHGDDARARLTINWLPHTTAEAFEQWLLTPGTGESPSLLPLAGEGGPKGRMREASRRVGHASGDDASRHPPHPAAAPPPSPAGGRGEALRTPAQVLRAHLPERLAGALLAIAAVDPQKPLRQLTRDERRAFARTVCALDLPITGDRGWTHAEVTAGGVPLREVHLDTLESRVCPGVHLCGEILDVDGRIGGFNFQWAWASGFVAGGGAVHGFPEP